MSGARRRHRELLAISVALVGLTLVFLFYTVMRADSDGAAPPEWGRVAADGKYLLWMGPAARAGSQAGGCLLFEYRKSDTSVCFDSRGGARVKHEGYRSGYSVAAKRDDSGQEFSLRLRRSDLMLRPGKPSVRYCQDRSCRQSTLLEERLRIEPAVLTSCQATAPWRTSNVSTDEKVIALTLDDGPGDFTGEALEALDKHAVPATFFVVGVHARERMALLNETVRRGHVVANHTYYHPDLSVMDEARVKDELTSTEQILEEANGFGSCVMRAPMGRDGGAAAAVARSLGLVSVNWNAGAHDYLGLSRERITTDTLSLAKPGAIILLHDGGPRQETVAALPGIIKTLRDQGYRFVTVPELLKLKTSYQ